MNKKGVIGATLLWFFVTPLLILFIILFIAGAFIIGTGSNLGGLIEGISDEGYYSLKGLRDDSVLAESFNGFLKDNLELVKSNVEEDLEIVKLKATKYIAYNILDFDEGNSLYERATFHIFDLDEFGKYDWTDVFGLGYDYSGYWLYHPARGFHNSPPSRCVESSGLNGNFVYNVFLKDRWVTLCVQYGGLRKNG